MTNIDFTKKRQRKIPQNFVTICSEIKCPRESRAAKEEEIRSAILGLGNPANKEITPRLKQFKRLHFMSMHVVSGQGDHEPSYVLLEMSIDGHDTDAIKAICEFMGNELFEIYELAGRVKSKTRLCAALIEDNVKITQSVWPEFYRGNNSNGLEFSGTAGLEAADIHNDSTIAEYARSIIEHEVHQHSETTDGNNARPASEPMHDLSPHKIFEYVQRRIDTEAENDDVRHAWAEAKPYSVTPNYAEDSTAVWKTNWDIVTLAKNIIPPVVYIHIGWIFLAVASLIWLGLFNGPGAAKDYFQATGLKPIVHINQIDPALSQQGFFHSPKFVLFGIAWAAIIAAAIDTLLLRYKRPGAVIWFSLAFAVYITFPQIFELFSNFTNIKVLAAQTVDALGTLRPSSLLSPFEGYFEKIGLAASGLAVKLAALAGTFVAIILAGKILHRKLPGSVYFLIAAATFLYLIRTVAIHFSTVTKAFQNQAYNISNAPAPLELPALTPVNLLSSAGLHEMIFYPFGLALALLAALYAAISHAPIAIKSLAYTPIDRLVVALENYQIRVPWLAGFSAFIKSRALYVAFFFGSFFAIFWRAFLPPLDRRIFDPSSVATPETSWTFLAQVILIPLVLAIVAIVLYFATNRTLGRKTNNGEKRSLAARFGKPVFLFWAFFAVWVNGNLIFTGKGIKIISSFMLALPLMFIVLATLFGIMWLFIRRSEVQNTPEDFNPDENAVAAMLDAENKNLSQNHMISVQRLLPQSYRKRFTMPFAFTILLEVVKKQRFRPGFLANMGTVHYARWVHLPKTNNYIFLSNYDGSWESYLEDFVTKAREGLNAAWSHCIGFPNVRGVFFEGSSNGDRFKRWARRSMQPTPFWYSAYPNLSAEEIRRNALIRDGLATTNLSPSDAAAWLDLFSSIPRPENQLQADQIQSLVFGGSGNLRFGACLPITRFKANDPHETIPPLKLSEWINAVLPHITFDDKAPIGSAAYMGLSAEGLSFLGMDDVLGRGLGDKRSPVTQFPPAFTMGMSHPGRASINFDEGRNEPSEWAWGKKEDHVLAVLMVYADTKANLAAKIDALTSKVRYRQSSQSSAYRSLSDYGLANENPIPLTDLKDKKPGEFDAEPFGFADGISQPILEGSRRAGKAAGSIHLVKPGEFVLGYKDNRGYFPPSPQLDASRDIDNHLPAIPRHIPQRYPKFDIPKERPPRDFGRNGTFMVIRQLEQNVDIFNQNKAEAAAYMMGLRVFTPDLVEELSLPDDLAHKSINDLDNPDLFLLATSLQPSLAVKLGDITPRRPSPEQIGEMKAAVYASIRKNRIEQMARQLEISLKDAEAEFDKREKKWLSAIPELMVGRKKDGTSLMACPYKIIKKPGEPVDIEEGRKSKSYNIKQDNEFLFGRDDPQGYRCPYGSHIRRSNPRDGLDTENKDALAIANRHRILRRGRAFGTEGEAQGTFFVCLNSDIERQFEFIQQTWIASPKFHGMRDEVDPIVGQGIHPDYGIPENDMKFTVQAPLGDLRIGGLSSYVTLRGGGYFFMPSRDSLGFLACQRAKNDD